MKKFYVFGVCLFIALLLLVSSKFCYAQEEFGRTQGDAISTIKMDIFYDSELSLPTEGDYVNLLFQMTPIQTKTTQDFGVLYYIISPENIVYKTGVAFFPHGSYYNNQTYQSDITIRLNLPGIWKLKYVVVTNHDLELIDGQFNDYLNTGVLYTEPIHVLSFYEATSVQISNNALMVSVIGVIGTFLAFLLGLFGNFLIDKYNNSPRIKVVASSCGFVSDGVNQTQTFSIEAINYGRVGVTLDSVGILLKKPNKKLHFLRGSITPLNLPYELLPGKRYSVIRSYAQMKRDIGSKIPDKTYLTDQTGKKYLSKSIKNMFKMNPLEEGDSE